MSKKLEASTLHFDLSMYSQEHEFTLLAGGGRRHVLKRYADHPAKLDEHRARNTVLGLIGEEHLSKITHFVEDAQMNALKPSIRRIVMPSMDDHPLEEIAMVFAHIPREHVGHAHARFYRDRVAPHPYALAAYGHCPDAYHAMMADHGAGTAHDLHYHAQAVQPPGATAQSIVLQHPEIGSINPGVMTYVKDTYLSPTSSQDMSDLVQYIQRTSPGMGSYTWYNKSWVKWAENTDGTGDMVPAEVNTDLEYAGGQKKTDWPTAPGQSYQGMPSYDLTDEYDPPKGNSDLESVIEAASPAVKSTLLGTKNDDQLNGLLWTKQSGVTETVASKPTVTNTAPPSAGGAAAKRAVTSDMVLAASGDAKGFTVKNKTSSYGLYQYDLSFDNTSKMITLPLKNWPSRYLGAYVQFQSEDGTVLKQSELKFASANPPIEAWPDKVPFDFIKFFVEPSDEKNYLTWLSSGNSVFGAPVPPLTQKTNLEFPWPDNATKAQILLGGLGCAGGFKDWDNDVDIVGVLGTGLINYGVGTITLLADVYIVNPFIDALEGDNAVAFYAICGVIGASALVVGVAEKDNSFGKAILSKLAGIAASAIFGAAAKRAIMYAAKSYIVKFTEATAEMVAEMTVEEVAEEVPIAGWALRVVSIAADIAALAATTVECLLSPATYDLEILHTMDLKVKVKPDPTHGKLPEYPAIWPAVAEHYVIQVKYPGGKGQQGGTTYTKAGPMPGPHDAPIEVTFEGVPAGGKVEVVASIYSDTDWLAGSFNSGWIDAIPDANDSLSVEGAIKELLVPLTADTKYSQKQAIAYSDAKQHYWAVSAFSVSANLVPDFDKGGTPDAAILSAFDENGDPLSSGATITVGTPLSSWTVKDPASGASFDVAAKQIFIGDVFKLSPASTYVGDLDAGGAPDAALKSAFEEAMYQLPDNAAVTVISSGSAWSIAGPGLLPVYELSLSGSDIQVKETQYELTVQNTIQSAPPLPQTYPLSSSPTGNAVGALQNIIVNNHEFCLGYAYLASGQNLPIDDQPGATGAPMYAMQSISTLSQPQEQLIVPTKGFSQPTFIAYDQFGLTPLFQMDEALETQLQDGPVSDDVAAQFKAFGYTLSKSATLSVVVAGKDWTVTDGGDEPTYEIRQVDVQKDGKTVQELGVFTYPVPGLDNFFLEPQASEPGQALKFYLRGVQLDEPPGVYEFQYSKPGDTAIWGIFTNETPFQEMAVHPSGYVIGLDNTNAKMFALKLPANAMEPKDAPVAMPLAGKGGREGLLDSPQAMTVTADGRILILETGTKYIKDKRIQAFDVKGNPVPCFSVNMPSFPITGTMADTIASQLDTLDVSQDLLNLFQENVTPAQATKAVQTQSMDASVSAFDSGSIDSAFLDTLQKFGLAKTDATTGDFTVSITKAGALWYVTDTKSQAVYDVRYETSSQTGFKAIDVYMQFGLSVVVRALGADWKVNDSVNAMNFEVTKDPDTKALTVQQLSSFMPLRTQSPNGVLSYLDIATETKGYIYVLGVDDNNYAADPKPENLVFQLDIYNPDGTPLLSAPQTGLNAGKITVDQYRSLFSLNYNVIIGPDTRTEPGVSQWIPSTPGPAT